MPTCLTEADALKIKSSANVVCPAKYKAGSIWGTDTYTTDSSICLAAIHAGVIQADAGGKVKVKITKGLSSYEGSTRNGVTTHKWGSYDSSFTVK